MNSKFSVSNFNVNDKKNNNFFGKFFAYLNLKNVFFLVVLMFIFFSFLTSVLYLSLRHNGDIFIKKEKKYILYFILCISVVIFSFFGIIFEIVKLNELKEDQNLFKNNPKYISKTLKKVVLQKHNSVILFFTIVFPVTIIIVLASITAYFFPTVIEYLTKTLKSVTLQQKLKNVKIYNMKIFYSLLAVSIFIIIVSFTFFIKNKILSNRIHFHYEKEIVNFEEIKNYKRKVYLFAFIFWLIIGIVFFLIYYIIKHCPKIIPFKSKSK